MTEKEMLTILNKFARELLKHYNKQLLVESGLDLTKLPTEPYDLYTTLAELGASIELLLMETDVALGELEVRDKRSKK